MRGKVAARKLRAVVRIAEARGVAPHSLLADAGLTEADLADDDRYLGLDVWRDLWRAAVLRSGDHELGLKAGGCVDRGYFGVIDYLVRSSPDIEHAITAAQRHFRLANTQGELRLCHEPGGIVSVERVIAGDHGVLPPQAAEFALAAMVKLFRDACAASFRLAHVCFRHAAPPDASTHRGYFDCPVKFSADRDAICVDAAVLRLPMRAPDAALRHLIERHAEALMCQLSDEASDTIVNGVRRALMERLHHGDATVEPIARHLGCSRRTLQRQLREHATSFREVLESVRRELATEYLRHGAMATGEVALLLGYADVTSFHRAFRGWTGTTPGAYRLQRNC